MKRILNYMNKFEEALVVVLFILLIIAGVAQVIFRFFLDYSLAWTEEMARFVFILLVYVSASLAITNKRHVRVEAIDSILPKYVQPYIRSFADIVWLIVSLNIVYHGYKIAVEAYRVGEKSAAMLLPMGIIYLIIPITFFLMSLRIIEQIFKRHWKKDGEIV